MLLIGGCVAYAQSRGKGFNINAGAGGKSKRDGDDWLAGTVSSSGKKKKKH